MTQWYQGTPYYVGNQWSICLGRIRQCKTSGVGLLNKVTVNGWDIRLGHPFGMSGARITNHLVHQFKEDGGASTIAIQKVLKIQPLQAYTYLFQEYFKILPEFDWFWASFSKRLIKANCWRSDMGACWITKGSGVAPPALPATASGEDIFKHYSFAELSLPLNINFEFDQVLAVFNSYSAKEFFCRCLPWCRLNHENAAIHARNVCVVDSSKITRSSDTHFRRHFRKSILDIGSKVISWLKYKIFTWSLMIFYKWILSFYLNFIDILMA